MKCLVPSCRCVKGKKSKGKSFFYFPTNPDKRELWIKSLKLDRNTVMESSRICSNHFKRCDYKNPNAIKCKNLYSFAIPSIIPDISQCSWPNAPPNIHICGQFNKRTSNADSKSEINVDKRISPVYDEENDDDDETPILDVESNIEYVDVKSKNTKAKSKKSTEIEEPTKEIMETIEIIKYDDEFIFEHTCRTCTELIDDKNDLVSILDDVEITIKPNIKFHLNDELILLDVNIHKNDGLPQQICMDCVNNLTKIFIYRELCKKSSEILKEYFKTFNLNRNEFLQNYDMNESKIEEQDKNGIDKNDQKKKTIVSKNDNFLIFDVNEITGKSKKNNTKTDFIHLYKNENKKLKPEQNSIPDEYDKDMMDLKQKYPKDIISIHEAEINDSLSVNASNSPCLYDESHKENISNKNDSTINETEDNDSQIILQTVATLDDISDYDNDDNHREQSEVFLNYEELLDTLVGNDKYSSLINDDNIDTDDDDERNMKNSNIIEYDMSNSIKMKTNLNSTETSDKKNEKNINSKTEKDINEKHNINDENLIEENDDKSENDEIIDENIDIPGTFHIKKCDKCNKYYCKNHNHCNSCKSKYLFGDPNPKKFYCFYCDKSFKNLFQIKIHLYMEHNNSNPFTCNYCDEKFTIKSKQTNHYENNHQNLNIEFKCLLCKQKYRTLNNLRRHIKGVHAIDNCECTICMKKFRNRIRYMYHLRNHRKKKYVCNICNKAFQYLHTLEQHKKNHLKKFKKSTLYHCHICLKRFKNESIFKDHMVIHSSTNDEYLNEEMNHDNDDDIDEGEFKEMNETGNYQGNESKALVRYRNANDMELDSNRNEIEEEYEKTKDLEMNEDNSLKKCKICNAQYTSSFEHKKLCIIQNCHKCYVLSYSNIKHFQHCTGRNPDQKYILYCCYYCNEEFETKSSTEQHILDMHPKEKPFLCKLCKKNFATMYKHANHIFDVHKDNLERIYHCNICDRKYVTIKDLHKHKTHFHVFGNFECTQCNKKFTNFERYRYHLRSHDPNKQFKCQYCDKKFLQTHHRLEHERTHTGIRPFQCEICEKTFRVDTSYKHHMRKHKGITPFICNICGKTFVLRFQLLKHLETHNETEDFPCEYCERKFKNNHALYKHRRAEHSEIIGPLKKRKSNQYSSTINAKNSGHGDANDTTEITETSYKCPICPKIFKFPASLDKHLNLHDQNRPFQCDQCSQRYKKMEHLKIHIRKEHLKLRIHECPYCDKKYTEKSERNLHVKSHKVIFFKCTYCDKTFKSKSSKRLHELVHNGRKPSKCVICGKQFRYHYAMRTHYKEHTAEEIAEAKARFEKIARNITNDTDVENLENSSHIQNELDDIIIQCDNDNDDDNNDNEKFDDIIESEFSTSTNINYMSNNIDWIIAEEVMLT